MALVDNGCGCAEVFPDTVAELLGHGAGLLPLVVEHLQTLEGLDRVGQLGEGAGLAEQTRLDLEVFPEVEVTELLIHLQAVVKLLDGDLIRLPELVVGAGGHFADSLEGALELLEFREAQVDVVDILHKGVDVGDHALLLLIVEPLLFLLALEIGVAALAEVGEKVSHLVLELVDGRGESGGVVAFLDKLRHESLVLADLESIECLFEGSHVTVGLHVVALQYVAKGGDYLLFGHRMHVGHVARFLSLVGRSGDVERRRLRLGAGLGGGCLRLIGGLGHLKGRRTGLGTFASALRLIGGFRYSESRRLCLGAFFYFLSAFYSGPGGCRHRVGRL